MKETGLMFKAPLVRAILSGQKTQTRRMLSANTIKLLRAAALAGEVSSFLDEHRLQPNDLGYVLGFSPVGVLRDRIYVRETHAHHPQFAQMAFRADGEEYEDADGWIWEPKWTPAIHMKKEEARIWLEITGVRVERLQEITPNDCIAEGAPGGHGSIPNYPYSATPLEHFRHIWESTGGDWAANPWVWVIDFKTISTTGRPA